MTLAEFRLEDRFVREQGDVAMSGVQALLRALLDQLRADRRDGLSTAALVSGYRGSPLGGVDSLLLGNAAELEANNIHFVPGLNEDLGATAVWGSQLANHAFEGRYDGVLGMWYGKAPGLDRSGDAIRHANTCGVDPQGGVVMVVGDDPASKSSTLASGSEFALLHLETPILYPGDVQEVVDYGRWAYELSRWSGLWTALKIVTNVADGYATVEVGPGRVRPSRPTFEWDGKPWRHRQEDRLVGPLAVAMERELHEGRLVAAERFAAHNRLDRLTVASPDATLGLVAAGKTFYDLQAGGRRPAPAGSGSGAPSRHDGARPAPTGPSSRSRPGPGHDGARPAPTGARSRSRDDQDGTAGTGACDGARHLGPPGGGPIGPTLDPAAGATADGSPGRGRR